MCSPSVYRRQAESNEQTALAAKNGFPDWAVIMCFYAALHWVNDYAFQQGEIEELEEAGENDSSQKLHKLRRLYVKKISRINKWRDLEDAYVFLFGVSMTARYLRGLENLNRTAREHYSNNESVVQNCFDCLEVVKSRLS
ncbi:MAG TPA: hypothetical protein DD379_13800 [Cyanobacteria bacterium UBA11162]|nr:hypothetical protein [Cyanobacteria bacterium UBA11162]